MYKYWSDAKSQDDTQLRTIYVKIPAINVEGQPVFNDPRIFFVPKKDLTIHLEKSFIVVYEVLQGNN